jgi:hypothetical protein
MADNFRIILKGIESRLTNLSLCYRAKLVTLSVTSTYGNENSYSILAYSSSAIWSNNHYQTEAKTGTMYWLLNNKNFYRLEEHPWFVGEMDRDCANLKLAPYPVYTFLVRCRVQVRIHLWLSSYTNLK